MKGENQDSQYQGEQKGKREERLNRMVKKMPGITFRLVGAGGESKKRQFKENAKPKKKNKRMRQQVRKKKTRSEPLDTSKDGDPKICLGQRK